MPPKRFFKKKFHDSTAAGAGGSSSSNTSGEQPQIQFDLGVEKKKVTVRKFKNMKLVDIREYYQKEGSWLPGSKGISLTEDQWNVLVSKMVDISEALIKIDDKEQFNSMKSALERKQAKINGEEEYQDEAPASLSKALARTAKDDDEEDEDIEDLEFEDVSEAPAAKRVKTE